MTELLAAALALINAVHEDDERGGGLLSRETIRKADELRIIVLKEKANADQTNR